MDVLITDRQNVLPRASRILGAIARRVVEAEKPEVDEVDIVLGDDRLLADLNARFRQKPRPTDVLSFPMGDGGPHHHLGEVILSTDRAIAQAPRFHHGVADEVVRLLVHGLLHLLGYEHDTDRGRREMTRAEREHLRRLDPWIEKLRRRYRTGTGMP